MTDNAVFTSAQLHTLAAVLDELIPARPDGSLPGAGALGVGAYVEQALRERPALAFALVPGLDALGRAAAARGAPDFAALAPAQRGAVLGEVTAAEVALLPTLMFLAYAGYYHDLRVVAALGLEPRPPHPQGYELPPNDLTLLEPVRRRAKMFREV